LPQIVDFRQFDAAAGRLRLSLQGKASAQFMLETSPNLSNWEPWTVLITDNNGTAALTEILTAPAGSRLFFRARSIP
jgi:hypothetical protein